MVLGSLLVTSLTWDHFLMVVVLSWSRLGVYYGLRYQCNLIIIANLDTNTKYGHAKKYPLKPGHKGSPQNLETFCLTTHTNKSSSKAWLAVRKHYITEGVM